MVLLILLLCVSGYGAYLLASTEVPPTHPYTVVALPPAKMKAAGAAAIFTNTSTTSEVMVNTGSPTPIVTKPPVPAMRQYLEITTGCATALGPTCARAYSRPATSSTERAQLRIGAVLLIKNSTTTTDGQLWYEIGFDEYIRHKNRLTLPWFIPASSGIMVESTEPTDWSTTTPATPKRIIVDRSEQALYAYDGDILHATYTISTGRELTPTPLGTFTIFKKTPTRYMQGPIPGITDKFYDLPGVPWNLYFTNEGAVIHGAYWHMGFGRPYSNGCVNTKLTDAKAIYDWAPLGTTVTIRP